MLQRRSVFAAALGLAPGAVLAQARFPDRPVRMIISVGVGGATDIVGRIVAEHMGGLLGRPVVPENIAGAGSTIGAAAFQRIDDMRIASEYIAHEQGRRSNVGK